jgi:hypothetical protein
VKLLGKVLSLFGSSKKWRSEPGPQIAMPLFASSGPVAAVRVVDAWARFFPEQAALGIASDQDGTTAYALEARQLMTAHIPLAVPEGEALGAVRSSWMWQEADDVVRDHRAHAIVTTPSSNDPVRDAWDVARLAAAMLEAGDGAALYWGSGRQVHAPNVVRQFAGSDDLPPVPLWVGISVSAESSSGPFSAATHGMESLGHKEFEVLATRMGAGELRTTLYDLALYVLRQGPILKHGQTFGPSSDVRWSIRHTRSKLVAGRDVIVLGIP